MSTGKLMSAGVISAIAASLCCIIPVLALIAGSGSLAASFSWIEPARPYLIGLTITVLGIAWFLKLRPAPKDDCSCDDGVKPSFFQSKTFLLLVTLFAALMMAFPLYAKAFFPQNNSTSIIAAKSNTKTVELQISGMGCAACEAEIDHEINKLPGIVQSSVSYDKGSAVIKFDVSRTTIEKIIDAVNTTGYTVTGQSLKN